MTDAGFPAAESTGQREYCQFGKRNLDGMSWLAPLVNNRVGDRLNLEVRHEQLFFIKGDQVLEDIGYSEQGQRFTETQFGKPIHSLEDLKRNGYWLVGREYDPAIMREALAEQKDGYYYSIFSNQCQDWADRLRRSAERLEAERGVQPGSTFARSAAPHYSKPVSPTEPASIWMGLLAILLGGACHRRTDRRRRSIHGPRWNRVPGVRGVAHCVRAACQGLAEFSSFSASCRGAFVGGVLILMNLHFAVVASGTLLAILITIQGIHSILVGVGSRPLIRGVGPLAAGLAMLACATLIVVHWPESSDTPSGCGWGSP